MKTITSVSINKQQVLLEVSLGSTNIKALASTIGDHTTAREL